MFYVSVSVSVSVSKPPCINFNVKFYREIRILWFHSYVGCGLFSRFSCIFSSLQSFIFLYQGGLPFWKSVLVSELIEIEKSIYYTLPFHNHFFHFWGVISMVLDAYSFLIVFSLFKLLKEERINLDLDYDYYQSPTALYPDW